VLPAQRRRSVSRLDAADRTTPKHAAYIKSRRLRSSCTFCIYSQLRGAFRSRAIRIGVREAENLARAARGNHANRAGYDSYGEDLGCGRLAQLLEKLARTDDLL